MNSLMPKKKNDIRHCGLAMPALGIFERKRASKRKKEGRKKDFHDPFRIKFNYSLLTQLSICFNEVNTNLRKNHK
jgi:hypothetical protein